MPSISRAASLVLPLLCLGQLAMVDALPQAGDTPCFSDTTTVFTSYQCGYVQFYSNQTYNCTIGSACPFVAQSLDLTFPQTLKGKIIDTANLISSLPSQLKASVLVDFDPTDVSTGGNLNHSPFQPDLQAKCPPLSDCGVIVGLQVWNLTGYQIPAKCSLPAPPNSSFESLIGLSGQQLFDNGQTVTDGLSCPGTPQSDGSTAMVCYLPDSFDKSDPNIPNCPIVPTLKSSDPTASIVGTLSYERSNSSTGNSSTGNSSKGN